MNRYLYYFEDKTFVKVVGKTGDKYVNIKLEISIHR